MGSCAICRVNLILERENESSFMTRLIWAKDLQEKVENSMVKVIPGP